MIKFIKMKKKIIFAVATGFFAVATVFNMNLLQDDKNGELALDAIAVMASATGESGGSGGPCPWDVPDAMCYQYADGRSGCFYTSELNSGLNCKSN
jgi:hypothetical protein